MAFDKVVSNLGRVASSKLLSDSTLFLYHPNIINLDECYIKTVLL